MIRWTDKPDYIDFDLYRYMNSVFDKWAEEKKFTQDIEIHLGKNEKFLGFSWFNAGCCGHNHPNFMIPLVLVKFPDVDGALAVALRNDVLNKIKEYEDKKSRHNQP